MKWWVNVTLSWSNISANHSKQIKQFILFAAGIRQGINYQNLKQEHFNGKYNILLHTTIQRPHLNNTLTHNMGKKFLQMKGGFSHTTIYQWTFPNQYNQWSSCSESFLRTFVIRCLSFHALSVMDVSGVSSSKQLASTSSIIFTYKSSIICYFLFFILIHLPK